LGKLSHVNHPLAAGLRRATGFALIVGLLISAVAFYRVAPELPRSSPTTTSGPNSPTVSASTSHRPSGIASPKTAPTPTQPNGKLPNGPGTTEPGILLMASPLRDGSFDIAEIVLLTIPTSSIRLGPPQLTRAGSRFSKAKPVATQVQVSGGSQPVLVPGGRINRRIDLPLNASESRIELRYHLSGITVRSMPSRAGRGLTAISPLVAGVPEDLRSQ
jgi:hypothetical protein